MYNAQTIRERLKERQKIKGVKNSDEMMEELDLGVNIIRQMSDKKGVGCFALAKIADYLDCSVDYLLGRTDTPTGTYSISNSQTTINGTQANVIHNAVGSDGLTDEFMKVFAELCFDDKVSVMQYVKDIKKSAAPQDGDRK